MKILGEKPGPKVGQILALLLEEVLDDPSLNTKKHQRERTSQLGKLSDEELQKLKKEALKKQQQFDESISGEIKKKYYVK